MNNDKADGWHYARGAEIEHFSQVCRTSTN